MHSSEGVAVVRENGRSSMRVVCASRAADTYHTVCTLPAAGTSDEPSQQGSAKEYPVALSRLVAPTLSLAFLVTLAMPVWGVQPSELLLPATTKGFISTHDVEEVRKKFNETQLGELVNDPLMKPFIDDLKEQIGQKLERAGKRLGVKWNDLEGVYGGEVALALIQPSPKDKMSHA